MSGAMGGTLTVDVDAPQLLLHPVSVDLAHVATSVALLHLAYVQLPRVHVVRCHADARVVGHHLVVQRQDGLVFRLQPTDLLAKTDPKPLAPPVQEAFFLGRTNTGLRD